METEQPQTTPTEVREEEEFQPINPEKLLDFGSKQIISLFVPVSICMLIVGIIAKNIRFYGETNQYMYYTPFHSDNASTGTVVWQSLANALIIIAFVVVMTIGLVLLYKYRCYKIIYGYLLFSTGLLLFALFFNLFLLLAIALNVYIDCLTLALTIWNFAIVGFITIHWKGPLLLQQIYLVLISANVALVLLKFLPQWTTWVLLGALAIWDLVAVLCPFGPLRILVNIAQERNEPLFPALIYSTTATIMIGDKNDNSSHDASTSSNVDTNTEQVNNPVQESTVRDNEAKRNIGGGNINEACDENDDLNEVIPNRMNSENSRGETTTHLRSIQEDILDRGDRGVKLGLGDFVFYSLLMGRATLDSDPATVLACYAAILVGMFLTLLLLAVAGRALPALPISMACGILFYFLTNLLISPFTYQLCINQVFI